jgi:hypothetical protein
MTKLQKKHATIYQITNVAW